MTGALLQILPELLVSATAGFISGFLFGRWDLRRSQRSK